MLKGIGVDIVQTSRFTAIRNNTVSHILSPAELERLDSLSGQARLEFLSSRFASKEALVKALGTGFGPLSPADITVENDAAGRPYFVLSDRARPLFDGLAAHLSISHEKDYSVAMVVLDGKD